MQQPVLCDPVATAAVTAAGEWQSFANYPTQKHTRQLAVILGLFVSSFYTPARFACVRSTFDEQRDNTSSWAQLAYQQPAASLSIPVAMMTGSTDGYRWHPQQCQRSFTVCLGLVFFAWKKVLRRNFVKDETSVFFVLLNFLNFLLSWLNLGFFINLTHTRLWHILQMTMWE